MWEWIDHRSDECDAHLSKRHVRCRSVHPLMWCRWADFASIHHQPSHTIHNKAYQLHCRISVNVLACVQLTAGERGLHTCVIRYANGVSTFQRVRVGHLLSNNLVEHQVWWSSDFYVSSFTITYIFIIFVILHIFVINKNNDIFVRMWNVSSSKELTDNKLML